METSNRFAISLGCFLLMALVWSSFSSPFDSAEEVSTAANTTLAPQPELTEQLEPRIDRQMPFYSQFTDIESKEWRGKSCGVTSVAMVVGYFNEDGPSPQTFLERGLRDDHYISGVGWTHQGLIDLAAPYGIKGSTHDFSHLSFRDAYKKLAAAVERGPVIASVHYKFDPQNAISHLVVIENVNGNVVYYNDPAEESGGGMISASDFSQAWKKRFIAMRKR